MFGNNSPRVILNINAWVYFKNTREVFNFIGIKYKPTTYEKGGIFSSSGKPL